MRPRLEELEDPALEVLMEAGAITQEEVALEAELMRKIKEAIDEFGLVMPEEPERLADYSKMWEPGHHICLHGITGAGKTTTLLHLCDGFLWRGYHVIYRDDSGMEWLALAWERPDETLVFLPKGCNLRLEGLDLNMAWYDPEKPIEIFEMIDKTMPDYKFFPVLFDVFCYDVDYMAHFYAEFLRSLIYWVARKPYRTKAKFVYACDELNDLIQPHGRELTATHRKVRGQFIINLRKIRKHGFKLVATTHRFSQVSLDIRSQFSYTLIHKSLGYDVYDFANKALIKAPNPVFWTVLHIITTQPPGCWIGFDYKNNYSWERTKMLIPKDKILEDLYWELEGEVGPPPEENKWLLMRRGAQLILVALKNQILYGSDCYDRICLLYTSPSPRDRG